MTPEHYREMFLIYDRIAVAPLPLAGATSPCESFGFQHGAAGDCFAGSGAF